MLPGQMTEVTIKAYCSSDSESVISVHTADMKKGSESPFCEQAPTAVISFQEQ